MIACIGGIIWKRQSFLIFIMKNTYSMVAYAHTKIIRSRILINTRVLQDRSVTRFVTLAPHGEYDSRFLEFIATILILKDGIEREVSGWENSF